MGYPPPFARTPKSSVHGRGGTPPSGGPRVSPRPARTPDPGPPTGQTPTHTPAHPKLVLLQTRRQVHPRSSRHHLFNPGNVLYRTGPSIAGAPLGPPRPTPDPPTPPHPTPHPAFSGFFLTQPQPQILAFFSSVPLPPNPPYPMGVWSGFLAKKPGIPPPRKSQAREGGMRVLRKRHPSLSPI